jgi:hypothetical protein
MNNVYRRLQRLMFPEAVALHSLYECVRPAINKLLFSPLPPCLTRTSYKTAAQEETRKQSMTLPIQLPDLHFQVQGIHWHFVITE